MKTERGLNAKNSESYNEPSQLDELSDSLSELSELSEVIQNDINLCSENHSDITVNQQLEPTRPFGTSQLIDHQVKVDHNDLKGMKRALTEMKMRLS